MPEKGGGTWREGGNTERSRESEGNSKRRVRSEGQEVHHGRVDNPDRTEPMEYLWRKRAKKQQQTETTVS